MPTYKANLKDSDQDKLEEAEFDGGILHAMNDKSRIRAKKEGAAEKTANAGTTIRNNSGVVFPHDDAIGRFVSDTQGRA